MDIVSACQWIFHQDGLRAELPTVTPSGVCPVSGVSNLADTEYLDTTFTGTFGSYSKRCYHLIPTVSLDHLVVVDGGHETTLTDGGPDTFGMQHVVRTLVATGYAVLIAPIEDAGATVHDTWGLSYSPSVNPLERFYGPVAIALNNLTSRYTKRSMTGLSGGGWMVANYAGLDPRINHATVAVRGTSPVANGSQDWEQTVLPTGFTFAQLYEGFYRLSAMTVRRLWIVWNPLDTALFGDASHFDDATLAPIRAEFPSVDLQYMQDPDLTAEHFYTQWTIDNALLPALSRSLVMTISNKHALTGTIADDPSAQVNKDDWNAEHVLTMATGKLLGRSTAATGVVEEITVGTNLTLAGGVLDASGGGGGTDLHNTIFGGEMTLPSSTTLNINAMTAYVESMGLCTGPAPAAAITPTLSAGGIRYIYATFSGGVWVLSDSATAPVPFATPAGSARSMSGDTSKRFIGAIYSNAGATAIVPFEHLDLGGGQSRIRYTSMDGGSPYRVLTLGTATSYTSIDLHTVIPPNVAVGFVGVAQMTYSTTGGDMLIARFSTDGTHNEVIYGAYVALTGALIANTFTMPISRATPSLQYILVVGGGAGIGPGLYLDVTQYNYVR